MALQPWHWLVLIAVLGTLAVVVVSKSRGNSRKLNAMPSPTEGTRGPGWYPDPSDSTLMRYYDGRAWTPETMDRK